MTMRINRFIASATGLSRRAADRAIEGKQVRVNGEPATPGQQVTGAEHITLDGKSVHAPIATQTIMLYKPAGYVVSRDGQGSNTVYDLLPVELRALKPIGRLDKDSSGLLLLTNDGQLAEQLAHPRYQKTKIYEVALDGPLAPLHRQMIHEFGVQLEDGPSQLQLERLYDGSDREWRVIMQEGRNRQIRRTFAAFGYKVIRLHRTHFGEYSLPAELAPGKYQSISP